MKWKETDFNEALNKGFENPSAVLIYGPDAGQLDELVDRAREKLEIGSDNLFSIDANDIKEKSDSMYAEACSPSFFGGRKMVLIANAGDSDASAIRELVMHPSRMSAVIATAGELKSGGGLRALFEDESSLAAVACYADDDRALGALIQRELFAAGMSRIDPDALQYMCAHLGGDRGVARSFLKKISIYADDTKIVTLNVAEKCLPDTGAASQDEFMYSLTAGHIPQTMHALDRLFFEGAEPIMLVRMLDIHFKRLLNAVVAGIVPRLFWKIQDKFQTAVKTWPESELVAVLRRLNELEKQLKSTGYNSELLLRDFALKLSARAAKMKLKRK
jgi:DNA polymerase-3 subunit delta